MIQRIETSKADGIVNFRFHTRATSSENVRIYSYTRRAPAAVSIYLLIYDERDVRTSNRG